MSERLRSSTVSSGQSSANDKRRDSGRPPPARLDGQRKLTQRHVSADDTGAAAAAGGYDDEMLTPKSQRRTGVRLILFLSMFSCPLATGILVFSAR